MQRNRDECDGTYRKTALRDSFGEIRNHYREEIKSLLDKLQWFVTRYIERVASLKEYLKAGTGWASGTVNWTRICPVLNFLCGFNLLMVLLQNRFKNSFWAGIQHQLIGIHELLVFENLQALVLYFPTIQDTK